MTSQLPKPGQQNKYYRPMTTISQIKHTLTYKIIKHQKSKISLRIKGETVNLLWTSLHHNWNTCGQLQSPTTLEWSNQIWKSVRFSVLERQD